MKPPGLSRESRHALLLPRAHSPTRVASLPPPLVSLCAPSGPQRSARSSRTLAWWNGGKFRCPTGGQGACVAVLGLPCWRRSLLHPLWGKLQGVWLPILTLPNGGGKLRWGWLGSVLALLPRWGNQVNYFISMRLHFLFSSMG